VGAVTENVFDDFAPPDAVEESSIIATINK
jgi:hypothetical protein